MAHYIKNKELLAAIVESQTTGRITHDVACGILQLAYRISTKPCWNGYSYRDELEGNAIVAMTAAVDRFDPAKSDNPFAYMTTVAMNSMRRTLQVQKRESSLRDAMMGECESGAGIISSDYRPFDDLDDRLCIGTPVVAVSAWRDCPSYPGYAVTRDGEARKTAHIRTLASGRESFVDHRALKKVGPNLTHYVIKGVRTDRAALVRDAWPELAIQKVEREVAPFNSLPCELDDDPRYRATLSGNYLVTRDGEVWRKPFLTKAGQRRGLKASVVRCGLVWIDGEHRRICDVVSEAWDQQAYMDI